MENNKRHGGPYDRGSADAYYGRMNRPHYFGGASYVTPIITELTEAERVAYATGYDEETDRKNWE